MNYAAAVVRVPGDFWEIANLRWPAEVPTIEKADPSLRYVQGQDDNLRGYSNLESLESIFIF
jgi:hypothetical protein